MKTSNDSRVVVIMIVLFLCGGAWGSEASAPDHIHVWLEMQQSEFVFCTDVWTYLFVENLGTDSVNVPFASDDRPRVLSINISERSAGLLPFTGAENPANYPDISLGPGDTVVFPIWLLNGYSQGGGSRSGPPPAIPVGDYTMSAAYAGKYYTNKVTFRVRPPSPDENEIITEYAATRRRLRHGQDRMNDFAALFEKYIDTPFGTRIGEHVLAVGAGCHAPDSVQRQYAEMFIEHYPRDGQCVFAWQRLLHTSSQEQFSSFLSQKDGVLGTRYARFMLRLALWTTGKSEQLDEVMGQ
jgi:hypothetical protein